MGFVEEIEVKPRYKGTTLCNNCGCEYSTKTEWVRGYSTTTGTQTPNFIPETKVPKGSCPMCLSKN